MVTDETSTPLLSVEGVSKRFPGVQALRDVSLVLHAGEVHALVGQNGAGKSTLVKCISGVHPPDAGRIVLDGEEITAYSPKHAYDLGIAVVHQRPPLLLSMSVAENVLLGSYPTLANGTIVDRRRGVEQTRALLARFRLDIDPSTEVVRLGAAERQQVAIAKALYRDAKLVILDEPTAALDAERSARLFEFIRDLTAEGVGVLYVSHHLEEVFGLANRITVLRDGELVATRPTTELTQEEVVTLMAGRRLDVVGGAGAAAVEDRPDALRFERVSTPLLHEVDLTVHEGEVLGVTGVIGAGGHELARVLFGLVRPASGQVLLRGRPYAPRGPKQAIDQGVFLVPEDPEKEGLVPVLSVATNVTLVDLPAITRHGALSLRREREIAGEFVRNLSIATPSIESPVRTLSGGNRQKVLLAKGLAAEASLLVLEEPTQGVDVHAKAEIHRIVRDLAASGKAVIVISTDIRDLLQFVDRVIALRGGRVVGEVPVGETSYAQVLDLTVGAAGARAS
jgi:ABC-type sugar transport system ATPase subunit